MAARHVLQYFWQNLGAANLAYSICGKLSKCISSNTLIFFVRKGPTSFSFQIHMLVCLFGNHYLLDPNCKMNRWMGGWTDKQSMPCYDCLARMKYGTTQFDISWFIHMGLFLSKIFIVNWTPTGLFHQDGLLVSILLHFFFLNHLSITFKSNNSLVWTF